MCIRDRVINRLLDVFVGATIRNSKNLATAFDNLSLSCLPKNLINYDSDNTYKILLNVSSFIASLTDGKALEWYKKMS